MNSFAGRLRRGAGRGDELVEQSHPYYDPARFAALTHHIAVLKERVVEVVAKGLRFERGAGSPLEAARRWL